MSTNIDRAAEVIALALADEADVSIFGNYNDITTTSEVTLDGVYDLTAVARALAKEGLIASGTLEFGVVDAAGDVLYHPTNQRYTGGVHP